MISDAGILRLEPGARRWCGGRSGRCGAGRGAGIGGRCAGGYCAKRSQFSGSGLPGAFFGATAPNEANWPGRVGRVRHCGPPRQTKPIGRGGVAGCGIAARRAKQSQFGRGGVAGCGIAARCAKQSQFGGGGVAGCGIVFRCAKQTQFGGTGWFDRAALPGAAEDRVARNEANMAGADWRGAALCSVAPNKPNLAGRGGLGERACQGERRAGARQTKPISRFWGLETRVGRENEANWPVRGRPPGHSVGVRRTKPIWRWRTGMQVLCRKGGAGKRADCGPWKTKPICRAEAGWRPRGASGNEGPGCAKRSQFAAFQH